jgi:hypothetical protein
VKDLEIKGDFSASGRAQNQGCGNLRDVNKNEVLLKEYAGYFTVEEIESK